ncbi:hypothetical protein OF376_00180 [Ureaplasma miroungigenitalium]|uniref:Uncharacterized protein n=1 Tax=Ureaplasma miroungigenitalium TaxID=1042321 RepID=A0ABT3BLS6_9BACT|nr:hypothetical protein [Ureaplasma miroungigenitalium]MCV3728207.1 hypothetical protein [Ureaplasma miroungigenitalium]MCV3734011.1 hypothetical protein [Ureaplasma miroungigenitalium]
MEIKKEYNQIVDNILANPPHHHGHHHVHEYKILLQRDELKQGVITKSPVNHDEYSFNLNFVQQADQLKDGDCIHADGHVYVTLYFEE